MDGEKLGKPAAASPLIKLAETSSQNGYWVHLPIQTQGTASILVPSGFLMRHTQAPCATCMVSSGLTVDHSSIALRAESALLLGMLRPCHPIGHFMHCKVAKGYHATPCDLKLADAGSANTYWC